MKDGFIKVCTGTPQITVADCQANSNEIIQLIKQAAQNGAKLIVLPELCVTGYTCGDLFFQSSLLKEAEKQLLRIAEETAGMDIVSVVGLPYVVHQTLYNCAAVVQSGKIKGLVPKTSIPNYSEFYEHRYFASAPEELFSVTVGTQQVPFGTKLLFAAEQMPDFVLAVEVCEDVWTVNPPSNSHALAGATVIANLSASNDVIGKEEYRRMLLSIQSAKLFAAYLYADAGFGESTTDVVFSGANMIYENGTLLAKSKRFSNSCVYAEIDVERLVGERKKTTTYQPQGMEQYQRIPLSFVCTDTVLNRHIDKTPFVPAKPGERAKRSEEILSVQSMGLAKRLAHTNAQAAVIGVSGGLDSTLALLVAVRAFDFLKLDRSRIMAVTMPCFGTTDRTYQNALNLAESLGASLREIRIEEAVEQHFKDISQPPGKLDVTYENAQARERTQVLMDLANQYSGLVVGTGDLSELALGWATYNGDHMSMYAVNAGVPKTLIRYLVGYEADRTENEVLQKTLEDILATPVSPELLPPKDGKIAQKTEKIVGPYELHDFFLFYVMRFGFSPQKILRLAVLAFEGQYERSFILEWMKVFYRRFFSQQFKRSCMPDGPKVGSVALSPRGDWRMPSDASAQVWMRELELL
jgi:NAD+ synthase (glutamine-hydrolysing)